MQIDEIYSFQYKNKIIAEKQRIKYKSSSTQPLCFELVTALGFIVIF